MSDLKVCNTKDLVNLCRRASRNGFNRQLDEAFIKGVDPQGLHLVTVALPFHNMDSAVIPHHRCTLYLKVKGSTEPLEGLLLDVAVKDFDSLQDASEALADA
jgi:hypothetical protein